MLTEVPATALDDTLLGDFQTQDGVSLAQLSRSGPVLVVFFRHLGCTFCREAFGEVARKRTAILATGTEIVLVHMSPDAEAAALLRTYQIDDLPRISDPQRRLYQAFGLIRGSVSQVVGFAVWWQGFKAIFKHGLGMPQGDVRQLPGAFLIEDGKILRACRNENSAELPDYESVACPLPRS